MIGSFPAEASLVEDFQSQRNIKDKKDLQVLTELGGWGYASPWRFCETSKRGVPESAAKKEPRRANERRSPPAATATAATNPLSPKFRVLLRVSA